MWRIEMKEGFLNPLMQNWKPEVSHLWIFQCRSFDTCTPCWFHFHLCFSSVSSVAQSLPALCNPLDWSTPGLPVHHQLPELTQIHAYWAGDAIQPSHSLLSPSPAFNLSQHQGLFKLVSSSHQVAKVSEFQLQHQPFQWTPRTDLL